MWSARTTERWIGAGDLGPTAAAPVDREPGEVQGDDAKADRCATVWVIAATAR